MKLGSRWKAERLTDNNEVSQSHWYLVLNFLSTTVNFALIDRNFAAGALDNRVQLTGSLDHCF